MPESGMEIEFRQSYRSQRQNPPWWWRWFPTLCFYRRVVPIVFAAASKAKRGVYGDEEWRGSSRAVLKTIEDSGCRVSVENIEVLSQVERPCVFIGNHMSTAETFILPCLIVPWRPVTFVVKKGLTTYPVFKHVMNSRNPVVVGREDPRVDFKTVIEEGTKRLEQGISVIVFPQRTRSLLFKPDEFNSIGVKLAKRAGAPVVPLALKTNAWDAGKVAKDFGPFRPEIPMHLAFGEPFEVSGNGRVDNQRVIDHILERLSVWEAEDGLCAGKALPTADEGA